MNDECADKIADNRYSIANSREWLVDQGGISDRVHLMSAKTVNIWTIFFINHYHHRLCILFLNQS